MLYIKVFSIKIIENWNYNGGCSETKGDDGKAGLKVVER